MSIGNLKVEIIKVELQKNIILKEDKILISMDRGTYSNFALVDDLDIRIAYQVLVEVIKEIATMIQHRALVYVLCGNGIGSIMGYVSFIHHHIVPLLINYTIREKISCDFKIYGKGDYDGQEH